MTKHLQCQHSVIASSLLQVFLLNRWDAVQMLTPATLADLSVAGIIGNMDGRERQIADHYYRCDPARIEERGRWTGGRTTI